MKHLKKLSVVLMLTTLFSVTFTSCIDNEVSPVVEAIYASQADLIAAQAGVQNAEAALRLAYANAAQATADATAATSASNSAASAEALRMAIATNNDLIATAQLNLEKAQQNWAVSMIGIQQQLDAAGATNAAIYLAKYITAIEAVNTDTNYLLGKQGDLATAELLLNSNNSATLQSFIDTQEDLLAAKYATIASNTAKIAAYKVALANPNATESQIAALEDQVDVLMDRKANLVAEIALAQQDVNEATAAITEATAFMTTAYPTAKASLTTWKGNYTTDTTNVGIETANVALYTGAIANYAGTTTTLTTAKNTAFAAVGQSTTSPFTGLKGSIKTIENTLGNNAVAFTSPIWSDPVKTGAIALTEYGKLYNAELALAIYEHDFSLLTATYNAAAVDLAAKQLAFNGSTYAADLATANTNYTAAQTAKATAQSAYATAKTAFEANPTGKAYTDGAVGAVTDLGNLGIKTDASLITYMRVATWVETSLGSGLYVPATFASTKYNLTDLALEVTAIKTDAASSAVNDITTDAQIILWKQDGTFTDAALANAGTATSLSGTEAAKTVVTIADPTITKAYFVEVESDDSEVSYLATFNIATNKLGNNSFSSRPFTTLGAAPNGTNWTAALSVTDTDAGYLNTWNGLGIMGTANTLTAQAALWNMALEVAKKQYLFDTGDDALVAAQEEYDYQQELFEDGLTVITTLENAVTAIETVIGKVSPASGLLGQWKALNTQLGDTAFGTPVYVYGGGSNDVARTTEGTPVSDYYMVGSVKTLTAYAVKWNAELALTKHLATTVGTYQTWLANAQANLTTATRKAAEDLIYIAKYTADLAALQARYDALILTPLYAALNVTLVNANQAKTLLSNENIAVDGMLETLLGNSYTSTSPTTPVAGAGLIADLKNSTSYTDWAAKIVIAEDAIEAAELAIPAIEVALALAEYDLDKAINVTIEKLKADIVELQASIAANQALAAKWKALMDAALLDS